MAPQYKMLTDNKKDVEGKNFMSPTMASTTRANTSSPVSTSNQIEKATRTSKWVNSAARRVGIHRTTRSKKVYPSSFSISLMTEYSYH